MAGSSCELRLTGPLGAVVVTRLSTAGDAHGEAVAAAAQHANRAHFSIDECFGASRVRCTLILPSLVDASVRVDRNDEYPQVASGCARYSYPA
jgi:hypothetical protein